MFSLHPEARFISFLKFLQHSFKAFFVNAERRTFKKSFQIYCKTVSTGSERNTIEFPALPDYSI